MSDGVMAALITGACSVGAIVISSIFQIGGTRRLMEYQIRELKGDISRLDDKVMKHNQLVERMALVESGVKNAHRRIDEMKKGMR